jgi:FkbM family methyltransferase
LDKAQFKSRIRSLLSKRLVFVAIRCARLLPDFLRDCSRLGVAPARTLLRHDLQLIAYFVIGRRPVARDAVPLRIRGYEHDLWIRPGASDAYVVRQVFSREEYKPLLDAESPELIIDCGANIGCTSCYLLSRFPNARLVAIEPDPESSELCLKNLQPFADRSTVLTAAVWSHCRTLSLARGVYRDGLAWATQVAEGDAPDVDAVDLPTVLQNSSSERISILKVDIEGSEYQLLTHEPDRWLRFTDTLAIELHDQQCEQAFAAAMQGYRCEMSATKELTICRNLTPHHRAADGNRVGMATPACA